MKKIRIILLAVVSLLVLSGCDSFRKLAGRPTSADIEAKRQLIEREELAHKARLDSLKAVHQSITDSLAVLDSIRMNRSSLVEARQLTESAKSSLSHRYYIVIGSFSSIENAEKLLGRAEQAGYEAELIAYRNGFTAVGVCPSNTLQKVFESLKKVRTESFCPADAWILDNK